jgi:hypothetical protein
VIINELGLVEYLSETVEGKRHDKKLASDCDFKFEKNMDLMLDLGFYGWRLPENIRMIMPQKKPKGKELSDAQKAGNKLISSIRVRIEHSIGGAKRMRIIKDTARSHSFFRKDLFIETAFALHNFRRCNRICALTSASCLQ